MILWWEPIYYQPKKAKMLYKENKYYQNKLKQINISDKDDTS